MFLLFLQLNVLAIEFSEFFCDLGVCLFQSLTLGGTDREYVILVGAFLVLFLEFLDFVFIAFVFGQLLVQFFLESSLH
jgi:hypothetical protein